MEIANIGNNAGKIWNTLDEKGDLKISNLKKITKFDIKDVYLALGWLSREGKLEFFETDNELAVRLKG
jgi:hypothetical protein